MILKCDTKYCHVDNGNKAHKYTGAVGVGMQYSARCITSRRVMQYLRIKSRNSLHVLVCMAQSRETRLIHTGLVECLRVVQQYDNE
jgi:hypothetical protein